MQIEDLGAVEETSSEIPSLGNGIETSLQSSEIPESEGPKDVNQYLEYMRQKREALEKAAVLDPVSENDSSTSKVLDEKTTGKSLSDDDKKNKNKEGEKMKNKNDMFGGSSQEGETSIEDMVAQAMQKDEILLYQQKYLDSLESRKNKVETIISMLQKEKETIDSQIQAVK